MTHQIRCFHKRRRHFWYDLAIRYSVLYQSVLSPIPVETQEVCDEAFCNKLLTLFSMFSFESAHDKRPRQTIVSRTNRYMSTTRRNTVTINQRVHAVTYINICSYIYPNYEKDEIFRFYDVNNDQQRQQPAPKRGYLKTEVVMAVK